MTIQEAIRKVIEDGYQYEADWDMPEKKIFLDPAFWQSLGKALGWEKYDSMWRDGYSGTLIYRGINCGWGYQFHRFIDHLIEGKTAESFFETL